MAAKTIRDAWLTTLALNENMYPKHDTVLKVEGELRDYFAHLVMKLEGRDDQQIATARELFDLVFKDIPAIKGE